MGIRIITSQNAEGPGFSLARAATVTVGALLVLAGLPVAAFILSLGVLALAAKTVPDDVGRVLFVLACSSTCALIGLRLIRGRRRLVLFLRRFGFKGASRALTFAVGTALGGGFRVVTLDDAELAPVGTRLWKRLVVTAASLVSLLVLGYLSVAIAGWFTEDLLGNTARQAFDDTVRNTAARGGNPIGTLFAGVVNMFFALFIVAAAAFVFAAASLTIVGSAVTVSLWSFLGIVRAELGARRTLQLPTEVENVAARLAKQARQIFAPPLTVLSVATDLWRAAVQQLAGRADILLFDISVPSKNLLWEIATLKAGHAGRLVLIGEAGKVAQLVGPSGASSVPQSEDLLEHLDGQDVLTYSIASRKTLRAFARALRATCQRMRLNG